MHLPLGLKHALESGKCVLFLGAGIGRHLIRPDGTHAPDANTLAKELADHFSIESADNYSLAQIAEVVEYRKGRKELEVFLRERLADFEPDETFQWLVSLRWRAIYTTNYDAGIRRAYELATKPVQNPVFITSVKDITEPSPHFEVPVIYLHGVLSGGEDPHIIVTDTDYLNFKEQRHMLFERFKWHVATSTLVYIGYSNEDPNWKLLINELAQEFFPKELPGSYRIAPTTAPIERELLKAKHIETVDASLLDFKQFAAAELSDPIPPEELHNLQEKVPTELRESFKNNPAATIRLVNSWYYVNQAAFDGQSNVKQFLRGDRPNWALIGNQDYFERDVEELIYNDLIDYATSNSKKPRSNIVLGPAGYGITTLLMILAVRLVREKAGPVFYLKEGAYLQEGDIEFACSISSQRPFFFIDNASDNKKTLQNITQRLKDSELPALLMLGDRLNEWRQMTARPQCLEFRIEPLSVLEIPRLLECLRKHGELGKLSGLPVALQEAAIKEKHGKELLVTLRETTEGDNFDAILESEYYGIQGDLAQRLYLVVSCFYQYGVLVRDSLLAAMLNTPIIDLYKSTTSNTEGVIIYECINEEMGVYAARTRHRKIAEIVWMRCGKRSEKEVVLKDAIEHLNLNYHSDLNAFEHFVRSDVLIDTLGSLDGKINFFETACKKDPRSPYVRQHFARMFLRNGNSLLALTQIDEAIKLDPNIRVLYHTKGKILAQITDDTDSNEIAQKRRYQSETAFRQGLSMSRADPYCYQGLAELYFSWAKREALSVQESGEYIAKAEATISEGLNIVKNRDGLRIISADIARWLGNNPKQIEALKKAVEEAPGSIIARYLLGRTYRKALRSQDAIQILQPLIEKHPDEFRSCIEYARALIDSKKPYSEAIAILKLGDLYGRRDPRYIATLGGMLFLNQQFTDADKVFNDAKNQGLEYEEMITVRFKVTTRDDPTQLMRLSGKVNAVKKGYAFIEVNGYPQLFCPGVHWNQIFLREGMPVSCALGFAPRGPMALELLLPYKLTP